MSRKGFSASVYMKVLIEDEEIGDKEFGIEDEVMISTEDGCCGNYRIVEIHTDQIVVVNIEEDDGKEDIMLEDITGMEYC